MLYAWNLSRRQARLKEELAEVKSKVAGYTPTGTSGKSSS